MLSWSVSLRCKRSGTPAFARSAGVRLRRSPQTTEGQSSAAEDRLEVRFPVAVVQLQAAFDVIEVVQHDLLGAGAIALGDGVDDHLVLVIAAALGRRRVVQED